MKYFLDSAKLDEIKLAYNTFGIDGVTTNPRHIMLSGKPFLTAITDIANWIKEEGLEGYEKFPVSVSRPLQGRHGHPFSPLPNHQSCIQQNSCRSTDYRTIWNRIFYGFSHLYTSILRILPAKTYAAA